MIDTTNPRAANQTTSSAVYKHLTEVIGKASLSVKNEHGTELWKLHSVLATEPHSKGGIEPAGIVRIDFQGTIRGSVQLQIEQDGAEHFLASTSGSAAPPDIQKTWLQFVRSAEPALKQALIVDFGTPSLSSERPGAADDLHAIGELQLRAESGSAAVTVTVLVDAPMRASLERLAGTISFGENGLARGRHDDKQLHRVIDVPLAVTLRFGQRQMTLRELLALTTGSLVELDRQVEEPVDLMLGERVLARGEVVIVDGNYGLRITEIVEKQVARELTAAA